MTEDSARRFRVALASRSSLASRGTSDDAITAARRLARARPAHRRERSRRHPRGRPCSHPLSGARNRAGTPHRSPILEPSPRRLATRAPRDFLAQRTTGGLERTLAQFQGIISLLACAATRGSLSPETLIAWVDIAERYRADDCSGYDGSRIAWLDEHPRGLAPASDGSPASVTDRALFTLVAGPALATPPIVDGKHPLSSRPDQGRDLQNRVAVR